MHLVIAIMLKTICTKLEPSLPDQRMTCLSFQKFSLMTISERRSLYLSAPAPGLGSSSILECSDLGTVGLSSLGKDS